MSTPMPIRVMTASGFTASRDLRTQWWLDVYGDRVTVFDDVDRNGVLWNHLRILEDFVASEDEEFTLVVQDDAIPLEGWEEHLEQVMEHATRFPLSLCHFRRHGLKMWERGISFGYATNCVWGQAVVYSREFALEYVQTVRDLYEIDPLTWRKSDDGVIVVHNLLTGNQSSFTTRALFDHAEGHSTLGHLTKGRYPFATIENSPGPWTGESRPHALAITDTMRDRAEMLRLYRSQR